jgi:hypothetical protein
MIVRWYFLMEGLAFMERRHAAARRGTQRHAMEPKLILVDGYNVIKNTETFLAAQRQSLGAARDALVKQLIARYRHTAHEVSVVFDGQGTRET